MFRSPADKMFLKRLGLVILAAEIVVVYGSYVIIGKPYWAVMAIMAGSAMFAAIIGFSTLFSEKETTILSGALPNEDPRERMARKREAAERMAQDEKAAVWFSTIRRHGRDIARSRSGGSKYLVWTFGPLIAVILVFAFLIWGGVDPAS